MTRYIIFTTSASTPLWGGNTGRNKLPRVRTIFSHFFHLCKRASFNLTTLSRPSFSCEHKWTRYCSFDLHIIAIRRWYFPDPSLKETSSSFQFAIRIKRVSQNTCWVAACCRYWSLTFRVGPWTWTPSTIRIYKYLRLVSETSIAVPPILSETATPSPESPKVNGRQKATSAFRFQKLHSSRSDLRRSTGRNIHPHAQKHPFRRKRVSWE